MKNHEENIRRTLRAMRESAALIWFSLFMLVVIPVLFTFELVDYFSSMAVFLLSGCILKRQCRQYQCYQIYLEVQKQCQQEEKNDESS